MRPTRCTRRWRAPALRLLANALPERNELIEQGIKKDPRVFGFRTGRDDIENGAAPGLSDTDFHVAFLVFELRIQCSHTLQGAAFHFGGFDGFGDRPVEVRDRFIGDDLPTCHKLGQRTKLLRSASDAQCLKCDADAGPNDSEHQNDEETRQDAGGAHGGKSVRALSARTAGGRQDQSGT